MKFWKAAVAGVLLAGLSIIPVGCEDESLSDGLQDTGVDLRGRWQLVTSWQGGTMNANAGTVTLSGEALRGSLTMSTGPTGTWEYGNGNFYMALSVDTAAMYSGRLGEGSNRIDGTMRNNEPITGTFYMTRL